MTAETLLHDLTSRGVRVRAEGDRLKLDAPVGVLTDIELRGLSQRKAELLDTLRREEFFTAVDRLSAAAFAENHSDLFGAVAFDGQNG